MAERLIAHVDVQALLANDLEAAFSPDGRHFAFVENQKGKWVVLVDGIPQGGYDDFAKKSLQFNLDSAHVVYAAVNNGKRFIVLDGREEENDDYLGIPQFSPDGKRLGYKALAGKDNVAVIDGVESKPYDQVDIPHFSPDSRRVAYAARDAQQWLTVIDAKNVNATMVLTHTALFIALITNTSRFGKSSGRNQ